MRHRFGPTWLQPQLRAQREDELDCVFDIPFCFLCASGLHHAGGLLRLRTQPLYMLCSMPYSAAGVATRCPLGSSNVDENCWTGWGTTCATESGHVPACSLPANVWCLCQRFHPSTSAALRTSVSAFRNEQAHASNVCSRAVCVLRHMGRGGRAQTDDGAQNVPGLLLPSSSPDLPCFSMRQPRAGSQASVQFAPP